MRYSAAGIFRTLISLIGILAILVLLILIKDVQ
jgi:hypothetical protein